MTLQSVNKGPVTAVTTLLTFYKNPEHTLHPACIYYTICTTFLPSILATYMSITVFTGMQDNVSSPNWAPKTCQVILNSPMKRHTGPQQSGSLWTNPLPYIRVLSVIFRKHNFNKIKLHFHQYVDSKSVLYTLSQNITVAVLYKHWMPPLFTSNGWLQWNCS